MVGTAPATAEPTAIADLLGPIESARLSALGILDAERQGRLGQFFTPRKAAEMMARMPSLIKPLSSIRILDPGAGSGMLLAAVVDRLVRERGAGSIEITAFEVDPAVMPWLQATTRRCEMWACEQGVELSIDVQHADFIASRTGPDADHRSYDLVIMNPPYAKLARDSAHRQALAAYGVDCPNLYAAFLTLGVDALKPGGQLVAITPRSFANGPYFRRFRQHLLQTMALDRVHVFESRSTVFSDTGVLQENIVFAGTKGGRRDRVRFSRSNGHLDASSEHVVAYHELVHPEDQHQFLRVSTGAADRSVADALRAMPATLDQLSLRVSTGRVVDFRARECLRAWPDDECVPLVYPGNLREGVVEWPREIRKPQGFAINREADHKSVLPPGCYVLVKRFTAKEERRRIVAAVWDPKLNGDSRIAFENHLNVFHACGEGLDPDAARGISAWLNSSLVDQFFRTFSGHTQVNATDLRSLKYPSIYMLRTLGERLPGRLPDQVRLDLVVESVLYPESPA